MSVESYKKVCTQALHVNMLAAREGQHHLSPSCVGGMDRGRNYACFSRHMLGQLA